MASNNGTLSSCSSRGGTSSGRWGSGENVSKGWQQRSGWDNPGAQRDGTLRRLLDQAALDGDIYFLSCDRQQIWAHQAILMASTPFFKQSLSGPWGGDSSSSKRSVKCQKRENGDEYIKWKSGFLAMILTVFVDHCYMKGFSHGLKYLKCLIFIMQQSISIMKHWYLR